ncbi:cytochrome P450 [Auriculariales sp. MPI-PUGE-AT-0066]|nr:cytochrome P450 [Auriculariales sp. MPI-PUGE-AT-0066]
MPKDKWYRGRQPFDGGRNILATNGVQHAHRRKMWDRGLGKEQILSYSASAERIAKQLITQLDLDAAQGTSVNLTKWVRYFAYDFMSIFAFGKEAGMTRAGDDPTGIIKKMSDALVITDFNAQLWWLGPGAQQFPIPRLITPIVSFLRVSNGILAERAARETDSYDLWHYLTNKEVTQKLSTSDLVRETVAAVIAGADTVANAAVNTVYLLLKNRQCLARARDEVDGMVHRGFEPWSDIEVHKDMPYLNACIDEALRLFPVVPVNGSRSIPSGSGGKVISNYFVPENTEVYVPQCVLHTSEQHFSPEPLAYHPERWLPAEGSNNKWHTNRNAFFPFSFGAQNCVGKNLARIEMVLLLSMLLHSYDMTFAQDFDVEEFPSSMHEHIVAEVGPMNIRLTKRSTPKE